uniref:Uncharacterized protein n=2 Tax=Cacopsylla melanoneura TaxID=428564 RepID=A0A8D8QYT4_9HEMI
MNPSSPVLPLNSNTAEYSCSCPPFECVCNQNMRRGPSYYSNSYWPHQTPCIGSEETTCGAYGDAANGQTAMLPYDISSIGNDLFQPEEMFPLDHHHQSLTKISPPCSTMLDMESGTIHPKLEPEVEPEISYCWSQSIEDSNSSQRFLAANSPTDLNVHMETQNSPDMNMHMDTRDYQHSPEVHQQHYDQMNLQNKHIQQYSTGPLEPDLLHGYNQHYEQSSQQYNSLEYAQPGPDCYYDNGNYYNTEYPISTDINDNNSIVNKSSSSYEPNSSCSMVTLTQTKQEFTFNYNNDTSSSSCTFQINQCMFP